MSENKPIFKLINMYWGTRKKHYGNVYELYSIVPGAIIGIGQYYDGESSWLVGENYPLTCLFSVDKKFKTKKDCMVYVVETVLAWLTESIVNLKYPIVEKEWDNLRDSMAECSYVNPRNVEDVITKTMEIPYKKIPLRLPNCDGFEKELLKVRLKNNI